MQTTSTQPLPSYIYMPLPDGRADVFIYKLIEEADDCYEYEYNEFRTKKLKESDIRRNPYAFLNYVETDDVVVKTPRYVEITREEFNLLDVEENVIYQILENDGTITFKKGVNR